MKKTLSIILLAAAFVAMQACTTSEKKDESTSTETAAENEAAQKEAAISLSEKRAKLESQRIAREQKRAADLEARLKLAPYYKNSSGKVVYYKAEVNPAFPGGQKALTDYLRDNLAYPKEAEEQEIEGTVFVDFVVMADGSVKEVEVLNDPADAIDQRLVDEAVRVVSNMPNWTPGKQRGTPVDVTFSLPITFQLN